MKPGLKTTEFWILILTIIGSIAAALEGTLDPKYAALAASISSAAYSISRGLSKAKGTP